MSAVRESFESVAVSTRMRLARNFADYPFPGRLLQDAHAEEQAMETPPQPVVDNASFKLLPIVVGVIVIALVFLYFVAR